MLLKNSHYTAEIPDVLVAEALRKAKSISNYRCETVATLKARVQELEYTQKKEVIHADNLDGELTVKVQKEYGTGGYGTGPSAAIVEFCLIDDFLPWEMEDEEDEFSAENMFYLNKPRVKVRVCDIDTYIASLDL